MGVMLGSIRTSWEQGTAAAAVLEIENPEYSVFAEDPFSNKGLPVGAIRLALSAAVRQGPDGRLSQNINDGLDGAALDGASAGPYTLLGAMTEPNRATFFQDASDKQLNYLLNIAPRTSTGAISMRDDSRQYWDDGVYMGPPFLAYYGAVTGNQSLLQMAYDDVRLYRDALLIDGPTGKLWAHIYNESAGEFADEGLWASGNGWAALGMIRVQSTIMKSQFKDDMRDQTDQLQSWIKEVLDGTFAAIRDDNLVPNYIDSNNTFGDCAASAALASVAYRAAVIDSKTFDSYYTDTASQLAKVCLGSVDELGVISPYVNPLVWDQVGILSTEGQAFNLMLIAALRDWLAANGQNVSR
ncbi:Six-hairpin glycosidase [Fomitiporia mediterranea MF3/22]|uniref:Six-hairpin glycosidase n=1 Tax=Fomitiporia mediterranea (strain MF3/22) TaxID=694068 RepID=UPI00044087E3|nr:Six-hairpin glycosidase [Fomitiporia mediterranea MF3/22]EJD06353.1 Six-hairpin glycosidase [Fomitiporia mediterranea MF3/22]